MIGNVEFRELRRDILSRFNVHVLWSATFLIPMNITESMIYMINIFLKFEYISRE